MATLISGKNTVLEAIKAERKIERVFVQDGTNKDLQHMLRERDIAFDIVSKQDLGNLLPGNHQGIVAEVADYELLTLEDALAKPTERKLYVMLDSIEDPHNLGAILRSADAFNVDGVIIPKRRSAQVTATVAKVSTGAIEYVDVIQVTNLHQTIRKLKENGFWIVGTDMDTPQTIHDIDANANLCVVIGSEGKGMSRLIRDNCDYIVKIPMSGHVNSLNASVSAAIVLYEIYRKRG